MCLRMQLSRAPRRGDQSRIGSRLAVDLVGALGRITAVPCEAAIARLGGCRLIKSGLPNRCGRLGTAFSLFVLSGSSQDTPTAAATVATASSVQGPATITTMCSMPRAAISEQRRVKASGDSPSFSRVLKVFSMSS
jgi:hypothetical protein